MLSRMLLDKLIPLPDEDEVAAQLCRELTVEGFPIDNLRPGGVFYTLLRLFVVRTKVELVALCREMLDNTYVSSANRVEWLELRAADFNKRRKPALKTEGLLTLTRTDLSVFSPRIRKGCVFKTDPVGGEELRYISTADASFAEGETVCMVPVAAEAPGSAYNLPAGKITRCLLHLEGVAGITNAEDWITREGSDIEELESLRARTLGAFADLAAQPTHDKYRSVCEAVPGVLCVEVHDLHPRGQGTVDILVTSATGEASEALLEEVRVAACTVAGPYDDLLVKSSETVTQDISVSILLPYAVSAEGVAEQAEQAIRALFRITRERVLYALYQSAVIVAAKTAVPSARSVRVTLPARDQVLDQDKVLIPGTVTVTIERDGA